MESLYVLRLIHIVGACLLLGTGIGIAFFMLMAHRTGDAKLIGHTASVVVIADWLFTATAVVIQPISGALLAARLGWDLSEGWILLSLALYVIVGLFWLPVVWIQYRLRDYALMAADSDGILPAGYFRLFHIWFLCGIPAFLGVLLILWLMITKSAL